MAPQVVPVVLAAAEAMAALPVAMEAVLAYGDAWHAWTRLQQGE